jgi:thiopurine S-methyltransferase
MAFMEKPPHQRAERPEFWNMRFQSGHMPWQDGKAHADLPRFLPALLRHLGHGKTADDPAPLRGLRILMPGCGHAFEARGFSHLGAHVVALDFSAIAIAAARQHLEDWDGELIQADFFTFAPATAFDLIFERAFLCALPRRLWPDYARQSARLLKRPGGLLAGFFFCGEEGKGPPFAAAPETLDALFTPRFSRVDDRPVENPLAFFPGERWQAWRVCPPDEHALA